AEQAILTAGELPGLGADVVASACNRVIGCGARVQEVRVRSIGAPFVGHTVSAARVVHDQKPSLESLRCAVRIINRKVKVLYEYGSFREAPFVLGKDDLFVGGVIGAIIRDSDPTFLGRAIRLKW